MSEDERDNVLIIWAGQLVLFCLKCDEHDLKLLAPSLREHLSGILKSDSSRYCCEKFSAASKDFAELLGQRFSFATEATDILGLHFSELASSVVSGGEFNQTIQTLRTIDAWSGLTSCTSRIHVPRTLLDYVLDALLPIVASQDILLLYHMISLLFDDTIKNNAPSPEDIDGQLQKIVSRLCFGGALDHEPSNDLKLAVLLHLPKDDGAVASNIGFVYELLKQKYRHEEAR